MAHRGFDRADRHARPIRAAREHLQLRRNGIAESRLPPQGLRRRLIVAAAVLDREPAEMRKAASLGHIHHARAGLAREQLAPRAVEADVSPRLMRALAEERPELALQRAGG